jgi:hypothetical protein
LVDLAHDSFYVNSHQEDKDPNVAISGGWWDLKMLDPLASCVFIDKDDYSQALNSSQIQ